MKASFIAVSIALLSGITGVVHAEEVVAPVPATAPAQPAEACGFSGLIASGMLANYDKNRDGLLNMDESMGAFKTFEPTLRSSSNQPEWLLECEYTFAMKFERFPKHDAAGTAEFSTWIIERPFAHYELSQERLAQAVSALLCRP